MEKLTSYTIIAIASYYLFCFVQISFFFMKFKYALSKIRNGKDILASAISTYEQAVCDEDVEIDYLYALLIVFDEVYDVTSLKLEKCDKNFEKLCNTIVDLNLIEKSAVRLYLFLFNIKFEDSLDSYCGSLDEIDDRLDQLVEKRNEFYEKIYNQTNQQDMS